MLSCFSELAKLDADGQTGHDRMRRGRGFSVDLRLDFGPRVQLFTLLCPAPYLLHTPLDTSLLTVSRPLIQGARNENRVPKYPILLLASYSGYATT
jgi:hypothetical protein